MDSFYQEEVFVNESSLSTINNGNDKYVSSVNVFATFFAEPRLYIEEAEVAIYIYLYV